MFLQNSHHRPVRGAVLGLIGLGLGLASVNLAASDWPQLLGPARNGSSPETVAGDWPAAGPPVLWQQPIGRGFSGPAVLGDKLIVFHRLGESETVDCLQASSGQRLWRFDYVTAYQDDFGFDPGPRATPALADGKVYTFGAEGQLHCLDLATGRKLWNVDTKEQFQAPKGFFGMACSPLIANGKVFLNIGGQNGAGLVAFGANTGQLSWKATDDEASYSSPVAATLAGQPRILFFTRSRLLSLDPENGQIHFEFPWRARAHASVNAASPLVIGDLIFLSASYQTGATLLRAGAQSVRQLWSSDEALSNHYATSVHRNGFLFGFHGRQEYGPSFRCVELATGKVRWSKESFGAGTVLLAADKLVILKEDGQLLLLEAASEAYKELGRAQILPNGARAYPAFANGRLYGRSKDKLACVVLEP